MKKLFICTLTTLLLASCSSYVGKMHKEFDRSDGKRRKPLKRGDQFDFYRKGAAMKSPNQLNSAQRKNVMPIVKRSYAPPKRVKADDLNDNGSGGSLWVGSGEDNFLFTNDRKKSNGDIVLIDVETRLKREITAELKRAYPDKKKPKKKKGEGKKGEGKEGAAEGGASKTAEASAPANKDEVFDRISSIVIEEINEDHILLRGRKFLLYKNRKRLVEVQALVPRREVTNSDTVSSSNIIESTVNVIR